LTLGNRLRSNGARRDKVKLAAAYRTRLLILCISLVLIAFNSQAQTGTSVILGTVTDASGAALPNAKVTATNTDTKLSVSALTDTSGDYRIPGLSPGRYELRAVLDKFVTEVHRDIDLTVSQQLELNISMKVGATQQEVVVSGGAPLVETATSSLSGVIDDQQMRELPLNGRDIYQLVALQAGVSPNVSAGPSLWGKGGINKLAVNGQRAFNNNMTIDGMDANDPLYNQSPGGASGVMLGVDAIQEFRVFTDTFSAEYGRDSGSVIQTITRSGTNNLHGSLFEYLRNSVLDAKNYFDLPNNPIPPFIRNQFGGSLGGAAKKDKAFFFVSYEGFREGEGLTAVSTVPDALAHEGLLPQAPTPGNPNGGPCTATNQSGCVNIGVTPSIAPYLNIIAPSNGPDFGDGTAQITTTERRITNEDYVMGRFDYLFSDTHRFFARYIHDSSSSQMPYLSTFVPGFPGVQDVGNQYVTIQDQKFLKPNLMNLLAFGFNRTGYIAQPDDTYPQLSISLSPNRPVGVLSVAGMGAVGNNLVYPVGGFSNTFQLQDNLSWIVGKHAFKFGGEYRRIQMNGPFDLYVNGEYVFAAFGPNVSNNPALEDFLESKPLVYLGTQPSLSDSDRGLRQNWLSGYVQDDWRVTPRLTLNIGTRYEFYSNPTESEGKVANLVDVTADASATIGKFMKTTPKDLFAPRVGLAWNLTSDGKTVLRSGAGIFYDQIYGNLYGNDRFFPPFYGGLEVILPPFLSPLSGSPAAASIPTSLTYTPKWPTVYQYNLNLQRELTSSSVVKVAYVGARGNDLIRLVDENPFNPALGARPNPNFGSLFRYETDAQSFYNGLQASWEQRMTKGLNFQANYTFSHSVDDSSGAEPSDDVNDGVATPDPYDRKSGRGRSGFDIRHNLIFNLLYDLPFGSGKAFGSNVGGITDKFIGGWQLSTIGTFHSNVPFTPVLGFDNAGTQPFFNYTELPNVVGNPFAGTCPNGAPVKTPTCWFNPDAYAVPTAGTFGNAGRDSIPGPAFAELDLALFKNTTILEGKTLQFRVECFNLLNHPNFLVPVNTTGPNGSGGNGDVVFLGPTSPAGNAGQIFSTVSSSRQIQFGLRFNF
jgi:hypothetical protein